MRNNFMCSMKKVSTAYRYERSNEHRYALEGILKKMQHLHKSLVLLVKGEREIVEHQITIILNFVNDNQHGTYGKHF